MSLVPYLQSAEAPAQRKYVYSEVFYELRIADRLRGGRAIRDARYKLIQHANGSVELYDLTADPLEATELSGAPEMAKKMDELLSELSRYSDE